MTKNISLKIVFESDNWIITKILQGFNNQIRIDGKTRFYQSDGINRFSKWGKRSYLESLSKLNYNKSLTDFNCYEY